MTVTSGITSTVGDNILVVLGVLAFVVGLSFVMSYLDYAKDMHYLDDYDKRWKF